MKKINKWFGFASLISICVFIYQLNGEKTGNFKNSPLSVGKTQVNESIEFHNVNPDFGHQAVSFKTEDETSKDDSMKSMPDSIIEFESDSASDFLRNPKTEKNPRPSSQEYQAYLKALNSIPLPRGRCVIQINSEAGVALANRYREQRRAAKRRPVRSFSSDIYKQPTNPRQTGIENSIASYSGKPALTVPTQVTNFTSARPSYTPRSSTQTPTRSTTDRYYDPSYRPSVGHHYVNSHIRRDGTYVRGHFRTNSDDSFWNNWSSYGNINPYTSRTGTRRPSYSSGSGGTFVQGYFRKNGTYVSGHHRRN